MTDDQSMLSRFGGGDTENVDLSIDDSDGYDLEGRDRVREYARSVATGGWAFAHASAETIYWEHPGPSAAKVYKLEQRGESWSGYRGKRVVGPNNRDDLQDALDGAGEWMADHPLDVEERGEPS